VYVFGGITSDKLTDNEPISIRLVDNTVWRLNLEDMRWQRLDITFPEVSYFHASCVDRVFQNFLCKVFYSCFGLSLN
jgi:hypothetical protein